MGNHEKFLSHLNESEKTVAFVADWLNKRGINAEVRQMKRADKAKNWKKYIDSGDIYVGNLRLEIKKVSIDFTCANDWVFGSKFIVCAKHAWEQANPKPYGFIILSDNKKSAALVSADTFPYWYVESRRDSRYTNIRQDFYFVPLNKVKFISIGYVK